MNYLIIALLFTRPFICEQANSENGVLFNLIFCLLLVVYLLFKKKIAIPLVPSLVLFGFFLSIFICGLFSVNAYETKKSISEFTIFLFIYIFVLTLGGKEKRFLFYSLIAACLLISLRAIYQHFIGLQYIIDKYTLSGIEKKSFYALEVLKQKRVVSWFAAPNLFSGYLVMFCPLILGCIFKAKQEKSAGKIALFSLILLLLFAALLFAKTIASFLGLICALIFFTIAMFGTRERYPKFLKLMFILLFLVLILAGVCIIKRNNYFFDFKNPENSMLQRSYYWKSSVDMIKERPWQGTGPGTFGIVYPHFKLENANETIYAHNLFLQLGAESGFLSLALLVFFIFYSFKQGLIKGNDFIKLGLLSGCFAFLIANLFDYSFYIAQAAFVWWVLLALAVKDSAGQVKSDTADAGTKTLKNHSDIVRIILVVIIAILASNLFSIYKSESYLEKGRNLLKGKKYDAAIIALRRSINFEPKNDFAYCLLAFAYKGKQDNGFFNQVVNSYEQAIALSPQYAFYYYYLSSYYRKYQMKEQAKKFLDQALKLYPTNKKFISEANP